jgi:hypothetical protein
MKNILRKASVPFVLTASLLFSSVAFADTPYYGKEYSQPEQIKSLFPEVKVPEMTPAFAREGEAFTTQEEMLAYIEKLDKKSKNLTVRNIGISQEGRAMPALFFTKDKMINSKSKKPIVWIQSQIHGNEPASGEAILALATRLAGELGDRVLEKINVIIVSRVNPDGSFAFDRRLANGLDGNRDHVKLESVELQALHHEFNRFNPEVVIDAHEYTPYSTALNSFGAAGLLKYHDILLLSGRNLNIPERIRSLSEQFYVDRTLDMLNKKGFSGDRYYTMAVNKQKQIEVAEGGTEARIGRNAFGLAPSFSFLVESRGIGIGREDFARRVAAQVTTHETILKQTADHAKQIKSIVSEERAKLIKKGFLTNDDDSIVVTSEVKEIPNQTLKMIDIQTATIQNVPVRYFSATHSYPTLTRERPTAYLLPPEYNEVAAKLKNQGISGFRLPKALSLQVEAYRVTNKENTEQYEGKQLVAVQTQVHAKTVLFPKGSFVFLSGQPQTNLLSISLEPESIDSYTTFGYIPSDVGKELPVYRFMMDNSKIK